MRTPRLLLGLILAGACAQASAQAYPAKPIRMVVGFTPGGAADYVARAISEPLSRALGQPIVVENRAGAGSSIAADYVAKSAPDGYTMLIASPSSISVNPALNPKLGYSQRDLAPITKVSTPPSVLPLVQAGRLRALAVTSRLRTPLIPDLPGMQEAGLADYEMSLWYGFFVPAATKPEIIRKLFDATISALQQPEVKQTFAREATETAASRSPEEFTAFLAEDAKLWVRLVKESGAKLD